ncbi:glutaminyl-peptide cyclotransferase [Apiospora arundinis]|uniref:Peptide hydrolase n=1 Tax=Apiospora arundinis TaxID=335852 RepID=A0ABR2HSH6_9PEZI
MAGHNGRPPRVFRLVLLLAALSICVTCVLAYDELSDAALRRIPGGGADFDVKKGALLAPILVPRVPGTPGSLAVQRHFVRFFTESLPAWRVEWQNSTSKTPVTGDRDVSFSNLVFTRDPPWAPQGDVSRLSLVAHYDSLYRPEGFIGAIDSAAPCAMLMHTARSIDAALTKKWEAMQESGDAGSGLEEDKGVQILLLDGEEAFETWTSTDSLYGARAMAEAWDSQAYPAMSTYRTPLQAISLFVLLDLLGAVDPHIPSYFAPTHWSYQAMAKIEARMRKLGLLRSKVQTPFLPQSEKRPQQFSRGYVEDDHIPFMERGVPILHVIPTPFPPQWHTMDDDGAHLDPNTVDDWAKIVSAFAAEWMEVGEYLDEPDDGIRERTEL